MSEQRLIDANELMGKFEKLKEASKTLRDVVYLDGVMAVITSAPTIEPPVVQWISVKDRLPKAREDVLVVAYWHEAYQTLIAWYAPNGEVWHVTTPAGDKTDLTVTHWMPLPLPPKECNDANHN